MPVQATPQLSPRGNRKGSFPTAQGWDDWLPPTEPAWSRARGHAAPDGHLLAVSEQHPTMKEGGCWRAPQMKYGKGMDRHSTRLNEKSKAHLTQAHHEAETASTAPAFRPKCSLGFLNLLAS